MVDSFGRQTFDIEKQKKTYCIFGNVHFGVGCRNNNRFFVAKRLFGRVYVRFIGRIQSLSQFRNIHGDFVLYDLAMFLFGNQKLFYVYFACFDFLFGLRFRKDMLFFGCRKRILGDNFDFYIRIAKRLRIGCVFILYVLPNARKSRLRIAEKQRPLCKILYIGIPYRRCGIVCLYDNLWRSDRFDNKRSIKSNEYRILRAEVKMKKTILLVCMIVSLFFIVPAQAFAENPKEAVITTSAKSVYLTDAGLNEEIYEHNSDERYPIASMVKIMTLLLAFEEIDAGNMTLDEKICISREAMSMGGSQMFLEEGLEYSVEDLLKGIVVVSANDACVSIAEKISGSEENFVCKMNKRAEELNLKNTNFVNCTGLPCVNGYSSARDCAKMLSELIKHEKYHEFSGIWLENYVHPDGRETIFTNTNKLIRFYPGCDGGKTGFTNEAGFCLSATAQKDGLRVISVVIGEKDGKVRFEDTKKLFNYAFACYKKEILASKGDDLGQVKFKGAKDSVGITTAENVGVFIRKGSLDSGKLIVEVNPDIKAPLTKGSIVGSVFTVKNGKECERADLIITDDVLVESYGDAIGRVAENWGVA